MSWTKWRLMPSPMDCRNIEGPEGPGVYQIKNKKTDALILFGISNTCRKRMKSLFPAPYGTGTRNNGDKRLYVLNNWRDLVYRTYATGNREKAKEIEDSLQIQNNHLFNT